MQNELTTEGVDVRIHGVNQAGHESNSDLMCEGRDLPWLEEGAAAVWDSWDVVYRDVIILDADNYVIDRFNLTAQDLGDSANYAALGELLRAAAAQ